MYHAGMLGSWYIVGAGRCGLQFARALHSAGVTLAGVETRSPAGRARVHRLLPAVARCSPESPLPPAQGVLLAVPDSAIADCAAALAPRLPSTTRVILHTSGIAPATALAALAGGSRALGSLHPLRAFPTAGGPLVELRGTVAAIEGQPAANTWARRLCRVLGMRSFVIAAEDKPRYHAAAVLAAGHVHTLVAVAREELVRIGMSRRLAAAALTPLSHGAIDGALAATGFEHLTGPLARGDGHAVGSHLAALPVDLAEAYRSVAILALAGVQAQGLLSPDQYDAVLSALTGHGLCASVRPVGLG
jgi:predicted short-subunit dehydrogenase-like oxidoreductase (DUF2520 family)